MNKFVGDEISLRTYQDGSAPASYSHGRSRHAGVGTVGGKGHIGTMLRSMFDTRDLKSFWTQSVYRSKVKTPIEFINSLGRALDWEMNLSELPDISDAMGMLSSPGRPGWLVRVWFRLGEYWRHAQRLNFPTLRHTGNDYMDRWSIRRYLGFHGITTAGEILEHFNQLLFDGSL